MRFRGALEKREYDPQREHLYTSDDPCQIQFWCDKPELEGVTFKTQFFQLQRNEVEAILELREYCRLRKEYPETLGPPFKVNHGEFVNYNDIPMFTKQKEVVSMLCKRLDQILQKCENGAFVRLSTRSPKDAALLSSRLYDRLETLYKQTKKSGLDFSQQQCLNFYRASSECLKVINSIEAVDFLLRSERTEIDLQFARLKQQKELRVHLVIREWIDINPLNEFRMFVVKGVPTSCTQYHRECLVPEFIERRDWIKEHLLKFFDHHIKDTFSHIEKYSVDFNIDLDSAKIWMIEVNHFPPIAGTGMFTWKNKDDRLQIEEGPFDLKIRTDATEKTLQEILPDEIYEFLQSLQPKKSRCIIS